MRTIFYHTLDITSAVRLFCRGAGGSWYTDGTNGHLDSFFGDPAVGMAKLLTVELENGLRLTQNTAWTFAVDRPGGIHLTAI